MAETIASALLGTIFKQLTDEAFKKIASSQKIHSELDKLESTLKQIQDLLNDASSKEITNVSVGRWLNSLQHLAYDIDDVLDDVATEAMGRELAHKSGEFSRKVRNVIPTCGKNLLLSQRLHKKLDSINDKLHHLEKQKSGLGLVVKVETQKSGLGLVVIDERQKSNDRGNETSLPESDVVGRECEKEKLMKKLLLGGTAESSNKENFSIVPIVGMGGVGKTTLARLLYNDPQVKGHFELMAWFSVSDDFDIFKISDAILGSVTKENKNFKDLNQLQVALNEQFKDNIFLLVLDDVWTESYNDWDILVRPFRSCAPGSRIIMTTRKERLLRTLGFDHLDHVESLSDKDGLSLLARHALDVDNFDSHSSLKLKGEGIMRKCGGLPLALKAIGRLLNTKKSEDWDDVLNSEVWNSKLNVGDLSEHWKAIFPALWLSYNDLSADLKRLFAYCSLFPKDFLFDKQELVLLWMAEGFLNESNASKPPELFGEEHFETLLSRSFFQHAPNDESLFVMHDLMNDLATFVAQDRFLRLDKQTKIVDEALAKYRHMLFIREEYVAFQKFEAFKKARNVRTWLVGGNPNLGYNYLSNKILVDVVPRLLLLRVLSLALFRISEVPNSIGSLKHLRYLNLSQTEITELPENFGNLYNLQTLIVSHCHSLAKLPKSFVKLTKLRHFDVRGTPSLKKLPMGISELKSLKTFTKIIIRGEDGLSISELKGLDNLCGETSIEGLHNVQSAIHAREANLSLRKLTKLELKWGDGSRRGTLEKEVLNELKPHTDTLNFFSVEFYQGTEFPGWVGDSSFQKLVRVSMSGCRKCEFLPPLGQLPSLKELLVQSMNEVKVIGSEFIGTTNVVAFSSLEILSFKDMRGWEVWSTNSKDSQTVFPCLRELCLRNCPNLKEVLLNALPSVRILNIDRCCGGLLRSLVRVALPITKLEISSISELTDEVWRGAIKYLGAVEEVDINSCNDIRYLWESGAHASMFLVKIKKLNVSHCKNLMSLGEKEYDEDNIGSNHLPSLGSLSVEWCKSMEHCSLNGNSIEALSIRFCESLTRVSFIGGEGWNLKSLSITECEKLMEKINNASMLMLEAVCISGWTNLKSLIQLSNSIHLTRMEIISCENLKVFPDIQLPNLTCLTISHCENLTSLPGIQLPNLTSLIVRWCENLKSFPDLQQMNLNLLNYLEITDCPSMDANSFPPNLVTLAIGRLKKPISEWRFHNFPTSLVKMLLINEADVRNFSQLFHLLPSSLKELQIHEFEELESLSVGLQHLTSLQHLSIYKCPKMKYLPKTLLPSLLELHILGCPILSRRCNGRRSRYWSLISHIPHLSYPLLDLDD